MNMENNLKSKIDIASIIGFVLLGAVAFKGNLFDGNSSYSFLFALFFVILSVLMLVVIIYEYIKTKNHMICFLKLFLLLVLFSKLAPYLLESSH